jgi:hypothetical protein
MAEKEIKPNESLRRRISRLVFLISAKADQNPSNLAYNTALVILNHAYMIAVTHPAMAEKLYARARKVARAV